MLTLTELADRRLVWVMEGGDPNWICTLRADAETVGSLRFETRHRAIGEVDGRTWVLAVRGQVLRGEIAVTEIGSAEPAAIFTQKWTGGGLVTFPNGVQYCWNPSYIWSTTYCFRRGSKAASVCVAHGQVSKNGLAVQICPGAAAMPETPVLVLLSGFLEVLHLEKLANLARM